MYYDHQVSNPSSDLVIPQVNAYCKPVKGMVFEYVDHAYDFYCEYAKKAGFCVRKRGSYMNDGLLKSKYFTCSKEGHKPANSYDSMAEKDGSNKPYYKRRKRPTIRCGCRAQIFLKYVDDLRFEINDFVKGHNHEMVDANDMHFVRSHRKLTHVQQDIIYEMSTLNLGPVKAFNIKRTKYGGFEEIGPTKDDCKNFKHNLTCYIGEYDAEMVVQRLSGKKNYCDGYSFEYTVNTNVLYNMVFVPFTAIDNHCRNVTVIDALLSSESIESYSWLLKVFLDFFGIAPKVVVTDQDSAMKQAISMVLPNSRYRLCMWHIMKKLADKAVWRVTRFPKKYMVDSWKIDVGVNPRTAPISSFGNDKFLKVKEISREITSGEYLINSYVTDVDELIKVRDQINIMVKKADETKYKRTHLSKRDMFAAILGYDQSSSVCLVV
ncbi:protein FAR1-RELATED SEQUENCE 5-like [Bidens hawaiensis]|uniref:protein FAR1-RELATED SEQUENCE 5-like n=1 Tax=Bidens hawaiensis TaxID=980011 RepID=UPI0040495F0E